MRWGGLCGVDRRGGRGAELVVEVVGLDQFGKWLGPRNRTSQLSSNLTAETLQI